MLDAIARKPIEPFLTYIGLRLSQKGITANMMTMIGLTLGIVAALAIIWQYYISAIFLIIFSRLADGLDGSIARHTNPTDFGSFFDIVADFFFYGMIPLAFIFSDTTQNSLMGSIILLSFYINGSSFLAYAIIAEKRTLTTQQRGKKGFYFSTGLAEATETIFVFILWCLFPLYFPLIASFFSILVFITALQRIMIAYHTF